MKEYFEEKERRGLPGGPNEMFTYVTGVFSFNAPMSDIFQAPSDIEGDGMFAGRSFKQGELIGLAHKGGQPVTQLGKMHNHNEESPTMISKKIGDQRFVYALKDLKEGEELTTNYRMQPELEQPEQFQQGGTITQAPSTFDNFKSDIRSFVRYPFATIKEKFNTGNVPYNFDKGIDAGEVEKDSFTSAIDFFNPINAAYKSADSLDDGDYSKAAINALSIIPFAKPLKAIKGVTPLQAKLAAKTINKGSKASQLQDGGDPERSKAINDIDYSKYNVRVIQYPYGSKKFSPGHIEAVLIDTDTGNQVNVIPGTNLVGRVNRWSTGSGNKRVSEKDYKGKDDVRVLDLDLSDEEIKGFVDQAQLFEGTERSSIHSDLRMNTTKLPLSLEDESIYNYDFLDSNCATGVCLALGMDPNSPENSRGGVTDPNFVMDNILENYSDKIVPGSVKGKRTSRFEGLTKLVKEEAKVDLNANTVNLLTNYLDGLDRDEINDVVETVLQNPTAIKAIKDEGIGNITDQTLKDLDTVISGFLPFGDDPSERRQDKAAKRLRELGSDAKEIYSNIPDGTIPAALQGLVYERDKWAPVLLDMAKDKANRFAIQKLGIDVPNIDISMEGIKNIPNYWKNKLGFKEGGSVSWQWKGKTYSGTLIPSMENEKNRYARTENGKIKTLPKAQDGNFPSPNLDERKIIPKPDYYSFKAAMDNSGLVEGTEEYKAREDLEYDKHRLQLNQRNLDAAANFAADWMSSPKYKEMLINSGGTGFFSDSTDVAEGRINNLNQIQKDVKYIEDDTRQSYTNEELSGVGGYSRSNTGEIFVNPYSGASDYSTIYDHEISHSIDRPEYDTLLDKFTAGLNDVFDTNRFGVRFKTRLIPSKDVDLIESFVDKDIPLERSPVTFWKKYGDTPEEGTKNYFAEPTEVRARLNEIRRLLDKKGVDIFNNEITPDNYKSIQDEQPAENLRNVFSDEAIIEMLNKISGDDMIDDSTLGLAQNGGSTSNLHTIYKHYINGNYKTKQEEIVGQKVYDKLNRVYYRDAKAMNMSPANYIMTYVTGNS